MKVAFDLIDRTSLQYRSSLSLELETEVESLYRCESMDGQTEDAIIITGACSHSIVRGCAKVFNITRAKRACLYA